MIDNPLLDIRIGTIVPAEHAPGGYLEAVAGHGFESFQLAFQPFDTMDFERMGDEVLKILEPHGSKISSVFLGQNLIGEGEAERRIVRCFEALIDNVQRFGADLVCGFTGRIPGVSIPDNVPHIRDTWAPLIERAADRGVRIAFENCSMNGDWHGGEWNIAHSPAAWERIFDALPHENLGLEWEPCHQMILLMDPMAQLRKWAPKIFHVHGKDASIHWDVLREFGISSDRPFAFHRTPGFGDSNWTDIISELRRLGFRGSIDIEGWHDPVYREALEMTAQVRALHYLRECRGGTQLIENPPTQG